MVSLGGQAPFTPCGGPVPACPPLDRGMRTLRHLLTSWLHQRVDALMRRSVVAWVQRQERVRLIQVGANDGVMGDPVHEIVKQENVTSCLVEPAPPVFARLAETYRSYANVTCVQTAIVPDAGVHSVEFYSFAPRPGLHWDDVYSAWSSTTREHLEKFRPFVPDFDALVTSAHVPATTLTALFRATGWPTVDLLQVDVEGLDVALVGSIPFDDWAPRIVQFEHIHSDRAPLMALLARVRAAGYRTFSHGFDTLCVGEAEMPGFRWLAWLQRVRPSWLSPPR